MSQGQRRHVPGWLRRLRGWQETPDWLLELIQKESGFSFVDFGTSPEEAGFAPTDEPAAGEATEASALLEWERVEPRPEPPGGEEEEVASEAGSPEQEEGAGPAAPPKRSGVTDWLIELEEEGGVEMAPPPAEMRERSGWTDEVEELASQATGIEPQPGEEEAGRPARRSGITDWLTRLESEPAEATEAGPQEAPITPGEPAADEDRRVAGRGDDVPDWLADLQGPVPEGEATGASATDSVPEWLADLEAAPAETEDALVDGETGLPPWLTALEGDEAEQDVPEWLSDLDSGGGIAAWLSEQEEEAARPPEAADRAAEESEPPAAPSAELGAAVPEETGPQQDQLPDWLRGMEEGTEEQHAAQEQAADVVDWLAGQELPPPTDSAADLTAAETPDWLLALGETAEDQEAPAEPESAPPAQVPEEPVEDETPDWLLALGETAGDQEAAAEPEPAPPAQAPAEPVEAETPDWLLALGEAAGDQGAAAEPEPAPPTQAPEELVEDETPDWLLALDETAEGQEPAAEPEPAPPAQAPEELVEDETPEWLLSLGEAAEDLEPAAEPESAPPAQAPEEPVEDETPDWLLAPGETAGDQEPATDQQAVPSAEASAELAEDETPDWLLALDETTEVQDSAQSTEASPEPQGETPAWLRDLDEVIEDRELGEVEQAEPASPEPVIGLDETDDEDVGDVASEQEPPDWLRDLATAEQEPEPDLAPGPGAPVPDWLSVERMPSDLGAVPEGGEDVESEAPAPPVPEWMEGVYAPQEEPPAGEEALSLPPAEEWTEEETPEWLSALEGQGARPTRRGTAVETSGPLAGLSGVLSPEPILANLPGSTFQPIPPVPDAHQAEAELVGRALETPASRRIQVSHATGREILNSLGRWVIYGLLLAAVLVAPLRSCVRLPDFRETRTFYNAIERLPAGSAVLVVFDYDASLDGTLTPQARAILWHLQRQELAIVLLSLTPQGVAIADDLIAERENLVPGRDYVDLGYLPPHPASLLAFMAHPLGGVARFGTTEDPAETALGRQVRTFADLDTVITITGDRDHIRWWIEQVQPRAEIELLAAVPAAITPYVEPYYSELGTGQIAGVLGGLGPTAQYEELLQADFLPSARLSYVVQTNALLLFTGVILVSGLGSLLGALSRRSKPGGAQVG